MTPAIFDRDLKLDTPISEQRSSLTQSDPDPLYGTTPPGIIDRLTPFTAKINELLPGVPIAQFTYRRQLNDRSVESGAYGAAMVSQYLLQASSL
jgi:hypothetical protein